MCGGGGVELVGCIFTPCACARGNVIGFVYRSLLSVISTKIARSRDLGI